jgi:hypothetical protein
MKFNKVKITKDHEVELTRADERKHSKDSIETSGVNPLPSFVDAVAAFKPYFLELVPALEDEADNLRVSTISLGEKDGLRSLQVSASLMIEKCNDAVISMTTPRVSEGGKDADPDVFHLSKGVLKLIANLEDQATRYIGGETAQTDAFQQASSENTKNVNDAMGAASVASTRRPRAQKPATVAGAIPTAPRVM